MAEAPTPTADPLDAVSDYGSNFDSEGEEVIGTLLAELEADGLEPFVLESIEHDEPPKVARLPKFSTSQKGSSSSQEEWPRWLRAPSVEVEYDVPSRTAWSGMYTGDLCCLPLEDDRQQRQRPAPPDPPAPGPDNRSPLERFRTAPRKPLSVTDIVSPAWCELQYWYTLTKHGKKKQTPAMQQGSKVHKVLEEEVHVAVPVDVKTKEDGWGLRIWNIIQGLRTLRSTGMTRELEIWGVIDGQVVNGVVDELSHTCPDEELERAVLAQREKGVKEQALPPDQQSITSFLRRSNAAAPHLGGEELGCDSQRPTNRVYLIDIKTRATKTLPTGATLRPTMIQLMLYKRILSDLSTNNVDASLIFERYRVSPSANFSDSFIAQIGGLDFNSKENSSQEDDYARFASSQDSVSELLNHNSLTQLWQLMIQEFQKTISETDGVGDVLKAEFRSRKDGTILGSKVFVYDDKVLQAYLDEEMKWWKGERKARGVDIEEAFKCRICEFAEECTWRIAKIDEATRKHRLRTAPRRTSVV